MVWLELKSLTRPTSAVSLAAVIPSQKLMVVVPLGSAEGEQFVLADAGGGAQAGDEGDGGER